MALEKIKNELWFREELYPNFSQALKVSKVLFSKISRDKKGKTIQKILIFDNLRFGRVLALDNIVQFTELDEKYYHEPLVHCSLFSHPNPNHILIIGGGDGGALREVVKHPVKSIDLVDIDKDVITLTKKYFPDFTQNAWHDPRLKIHIEDGADFVKKTKKKYDVIILDTPDPVGPAIPLFKTGFYLDCKKILAPEGILMRQTGSSILQPEEMPSNFRQMQELFPEVQVFLTSVPTYVGGYFTFVAAALKKGLFSKPIKKRFNKLKLETAWYTPQMHKASTILPRELEGSLLKTEYGIELIADFYDCDYSVLTSKEKLYQFPIELCKIIKMKPFQKPFVADFGYKLSKTAGPSLVQLIESSSITCHLSPHWRTVSLNIFSCESFEAEKAFQFSKGFFGAGRGVAFLLKRGSPVFRKELDIVEIKIPKGK